MENLFDTFKKAHETYEKQADEEEPFKEKVKILPGVLYANFHKEI